MTDTGIRLHLSVNDPTLGFPIEARGAKYRSKKLRPDSGVVTFRFKGPLSGSETIKGCYVTKGGLLLKAVRFSCGFTPCGVPLCGKRLGIDRIHIKTQEILDGLALAFP